MPRLDITRCFALAASLGLAASGASACGDSDESFAGSPDTTDASREGATSGGDAALTDGPAPITDSPAPVDANETSIPTGPLFGFVGSSDGKIRVYSVNETTGDWTLKKESVGGSKPSFLAFDPARRRVAAVDESAGSGLVRTFSFDPVTGALAMIDDQPTGGGAATHVSFDPTGKWVMVANYSGDNMAIFPIDSGGTLGAASDQKASGEKSHWAGTNPSGTHVFVPALGTDAVSQYVLDVSTGKLTDNGTAPVPNGAGPRHLAFHPSEAWAYVVNELDVTVTTMSFDKASGKLTATDTISALPPGQDPSGVSGAEIFVHPNGKFVYASTRIFNSIVSFSVNATDGKLTRLANVDTGGNRPRSFWIEPRGHTALRRQRERRQGGGLSCRCHDGRAHAARQGRRRSRPHLRGPLPDALTRSSANAPGKTVATSSSMLSASCRWFSGGTRRKLRPAPWRAHEQSARGRSRRS